MNIDDQKSTIKSANVAFQWLGKVRYQSRSFTSAVISRTLADAKYAFLHAALEEWFGKSDPSKYNALCQYVTQHPTQLSLKLKDSIDTIVTRYALALRYHTPSVALDQCKIASNRLQKFLKDIGVEAEVLELKGPKLDVEKALPKWRRTNQMNWSHYVVAVGDMTYDLTNRQFDPDSEYPLIQSRTELNSKWSELENYDRANG